jgi:hypothetical protein
VTVSVGDESLLIFVSCWCSAGRSEWLVMSRVGVLIVAVAVAVVGFVAGWLLLASAAEPELREPIVVEVPGTGGTRPPSTTAPPAPAPTEGPSIVPPPTVRPTGPPAGDDDGGDGTDDADDSSNDGEDVGDEGGGGDG